MSGVESESATDEILLDRIGSSRDPEAFRQLVSRHGDFVHSLAFRILGNAPDAQDASQNAWTEVLRDAGRFQARGVARAWIARISVHNAWKIARSRRRERDREKRSARPEVVMPDTRLEDLELQRQVETVVRELPEGEREVVLLHYFHGLSLGEMSEALDCSVSAIKGRVHQALERLRTRMAATGLTLSTAALLSVMRDASAYAAPADLAGTVLKLASQAGPAAGGGTALGRGIQAGGWIVNSKAMIAVGILVVATLGLGVGRMIHAGRRNAGRMDLDALETRLAKASEDQRKLRAELESLKEENRHLKARGQDPAAHVPVSSIVPPSVLKEAVEQHADAPVDPQKAGKKTEREEVLALAADLGRLVSQKGRVHTDEERANPDLATPLKVRVSLAAVFSELVERKDLLQGELGAEAELSLFKELMKTPGWTSDLELSRDQEVLFKQEHLEAQRRFQALGIPASALFMAGHLGREGGYTLSPEQKKAVWDRDGEVGELLERILNLYQFEHFKNHVSEGR